MWARIKPLWRNRGITLKSSSKEGKISYAEFKGAGKAPVTSDQIGRGQIGLEHLAPGVFAEIRNVALHAHTGSKSRRVNIKDLEGFFGTGGFYMYSSDGTKRYKVTINSATGAFVLTES